MFGVPEREASCWRSPGRPEGGGELRIRAGYVLRQRREFLVDAGEAPLVLLELSSMLNVTAKQPDLLDELRQTCRQFGIHCRSG